jgi:hypothetical protein
MTHNDVDPSKRIEVPTTEFERKVMSWPLYHQMMVHGRILFMMNGVVSLLFAAGLIEVLVSARTAAQICFLMGGVIESIMICWIAAPCGCGKVPALTAKARFGLAKSANKRHVIRSLILGGIIGSVISWLGLSVLGMHGHRLIIIMAGFCMVIGFPMIFFSLANRTDWLFQRIVPESEVQAIATLTGNTHEELEKLIEFHLKIGNVSKADDYSRKLLSLAENNDAQGKDN